MILVLFFNICRKAFSAFKLSCKGIINPIIMHEMLQWHSAITILASYTSLNRVTMHHLLIIFSLIKKALHVMLNNSSWELTVCFSTFLFSFFDNQAANDCDLEPVAYEFFTQAFVLYEEEVAVIVQEFVSCD